VTWEGVDTPPADRRFLAVVRLVYDAAILDDLARANHIRTLDELETAEDPVVRGAIWDGQLRGPVISASFVLKYPVRPGLVRTRRGRIISGALMSSRRRRIRCEFMTG
jgi:hypothetical protein